MLAAIERNRERAIRVVVRMEIASAADDVACAWHGVIACRAYHAYRLVSGGLNPAFRKDLDGRLLDFKAGRAEAIAAEAEGVASVLESLKLPLGTLVAVIPGHRAHPTNAGTPMALLAEAVARRICGATPVVDALVRYRGVEKLAAGGERNARTQVGSMRVESSLLRDAVIVVLDDIVSSGQSMLAARELLVQAGAARVACVAIARTPRVAW